MREIAYIPYHVWLQLLVNVIYANFMQIHLFKNTITQIFTELKP